MCIPYRLHYCTHCCDKYWTKAAKGKMSSLHLQFQGDTSHHRDQGVARQQGHEEHDAGWGLEMVWQQSLGLAGHTELAVRKQRENRKRDWAMPHQGPSPMTYFLQQDYNSYSFHSLSNSTVGQRPNLQTHEPMADVLQSSLNIYYVLEFSSKMGPVALSGVMLFYTCCYPR